MVATGWSLGGGRSMFREVGRTEGTVGLEGM